MDEYFEEFSRNTQYITDTHPNIVEFGLEQCIKKRNFEYKRSDKKYKFKFDVTRGVLAQPQITEITARILDAGDDKYCVDFAMSGGGQHNTFMEIFNEFIKSEELAFTNLENEV